jgi:hypothetical protein
MIGAVPQKPRQAVVEILDFMRKRGLTLDDLIEVGGAELKSANPKTREKARRVEKCWSLMAKLGVKFTDLENSPAPIPDKPVRRRRGDGHFSQVIENTADLGIGPSPNKCNEINDLANSVPVGVVDSKSESAP